MAKVVVKEMVTKVTADIGDYSSKMRQAKTEYGGLTKTIEDNKEGLRRAGLAIGAIGTAIVAALGLATAASIEYNREMGNIETLIPGQTARVVELKNAFGDMAVKVGKSATDLAQGGYQIISAFGDSKDAIQQLEIAAKGAAASGATTTEAINLLSAVTKGYGDTSLEALRKVSDLSFQAVKLGQTTFPELAASIGKVAPLTAELGVSQEELFAVMATGTGVTGKAAEVSTQLRGVMQSLMAPTADMSKLMEALGYANGKAMIESEGLDGALNLIVKSAEMSNKPLQKYISSIEGQVIALALAGPQADVYIEKLDQMKDSAGATDEAFTAFTEGINKTGFQFDQFKEQMGLLVRKIGDNLVPILGTLISYVTDVAGWVAEFIDNHPYLTRALVLLTAGIGTLGMAVGALLIGATAIPAVVAAFGALTVALPVVGAAMTLLGTVAAATWAALFGPIGIAVAIATAILLIFWDDTVGVAVRAGEKIAGAWRWLMETLNEDRKKAREADETLAELQFNRNKGRVRLESIMEEKKAREEDERRKEKEAKTEESTAKLKAMFDKEAAEAAAREDAKALKKEQAEYRKQQALETRLANEEQARIDADLAETAQLIASEGKYPGHYLTIFSAYGIHLDDMEKKTVDKLVEMGLDWEGYGRQITGLEAAEEASTIGKVRSRYAGYLNDMQLKTAEQLGLMGKDFDSYAQGIIAEGGPINTIMWEISDCFNWAAGQASVALEGIGMSFTEDILHGNFADAFTNLKNGFKSLADAIVNEFITTLAEGIVGWINSVLKDTIGGLFKSIGKGAAAAVLGEKAASALFPTAAAAGGTAGVAGGTAAATTGGVAGGGVTAVGTGEAVGAGTGGAGVGGTLGTIAGVAATAGAGLFVVGGMLVTLFGGKTRPTTGYRWMGEDHRKISEMRRAAESLSGRDRTEFLGILDRVYDLRNLGVLNNMYDVFKARGTRGVLAMVRGGTQEATGPPEGRGRESIEFADRPQTQIVGATLQPSQPSVSYMGAPTTEIVGATPQFHAGGVIAGVLGQERMIRAMAGEEVITRQDPRHSMNVGGGIHVNITGNQINSELDMRRIAKIAGEEIMREMSFIERGVRA